MEILTHQKIRDKLLHLIIFFVFFINFNCHNKGFSSPSEQGKLYVVKDKAILRTNPTIYSFEVAILPRGEELKQIQNEPFQESERRNWFLVETSKGYKGWIHKNFISKNRVEKSNEVENNYINKPEIVAKNLIGSWWEVDYIGTSGFRNIKFEEEENKKIIDSYEGKFTYQFKNTNTIKGIFKILSDGKIEFDPPLPIGNYLYLIDTLDGSRIVAKIEKDQKKEIYFRKIQDEESTESNEE